jgi:hypothetical protein
MAHFAELDENNVVLRVIVVSNDELMDNGVESEAKGIAFCKSLLGGEWKQTSYNSNIRKNYAGPGFTYDPNRDAFIPVKPFNSWVLDENTCDWVAPIPYPSDASDTRRYAWDEANVNWRLVVKTGANPITSVETLP